MAKTVFVRPARDGLIVRVPERANRLLDADGEPVPLTPYWLKRLREGDVIEGKKTATAKRTAKADADEKEGS